MLCNSLFTWSGPQRLIFSVGAGSAILRSMLFGKGMRSDIGWSQSKMPNLVWMPYVSPTMWIIRPWPCLLWVLARSKAGTATLILSSILNTFTNRCLPYWRTARSFAWRQLIWTWARSAWFNSIAAVKDCSSNQREDIWGDKSANSLSTGRLGGVMGGGEKSCPELWCRYSK